MYLSRKQKIYIPREASASSIETKEPVSKEGGNKDKYK